MKIDIRNRGKKIGSIEEFEFNIKKLCLLTATGLTIAVVIPCGFHMANKNKEKEVAVVEQDYQNYSIKNHIHNPLDGTYKVKYKVEFGDTLYGLVTSYCLDGQDVNYIIDEIVRDKNNDLDNASTIIQGREYTLYGVPYDHLDDFGYYIPSREELSDEDKLNDDIEFIKSYAYGRDSYKLIVDETKYGTPNYEFACEVKDELIGLCQTYRDYEAMEESEEKEKAQKELLLMFDAAKTDIELVTGDQFVQPAYPINTISKSL